MKIRGVFGETPVTLDSNGLDYERLVAAIELLEHKINKEEARLAKYTDGVRPVPIIDVDSLKEVLVVAGRNQKEIEVI